MPKKNAISLRQTHASLTEDEKNNGIKVLDACSDRYFVPVDKGGWIEVTIGWIVPEIIFGHLWTIGIHCSEQAPQDIEGLKSSGLQELVKNLVSKTLSVIFSKVLFAQGQDYTHQSYYLSFGGVSGHLVN